MKKSFPLFLLLTGLFLYGQTSVYAATVNSTINLTINCDQKCQNDALILYRFQGQITETLHKNVTLVNEANANVTCSDFDLEIDKSVQVRSNPTQGEWFVTGGSYDSPPSDGVLYELAGSAYVAGGVWNRFYVGASVPSDLNTVDLTSQDPSIVRCNANGCTALKEGTTNITLSFPVQNQVANLPVRERDKWGTFNARGDFIQYELEGSATGYGKILFMAEQKFGTKITRSKPIIMTYSFPSITCRVTVPPRPNRDHEVECKNIDPISDSNARVNWTYSDADQDVQTNYQIEVATRNDFAQNSIVKRETAPANTNIATVRHKLISDLAPNTQYYVRIRAYNPVNNWSDYSVCSGGFKTLEEGGCPAGQTKNAQGICVTPPG